MSINLSINQLIVLALKIMVTQTNFIADALSGSWLPSMSAGWFLLKMYVSAVGALLMAPALT